MPLRIGLSSATIIIVALFCFAILATVPEARSQNPPVYKVDPSWPKRLPNKWST